MVQSLTKFKDLQSYTYEIFENFDISPPTVFKVLFPCTYYVVVDYLCVFIDFY